MAPNSSTVETLKVAVVGCGAVTRMGHLPGAALSRHAKITLLVDTDIDRARALAEEFDIPNVAASTDKLQSYADAAVLALPHSLHAAVSVDLLSKGIHVLVEKPMAMTTAECDAMIDAADKHDAVLAVGLVRRFRWANRMVKRMIDLNSLGRLVSFDIREGGPYNWPSASSFVLKRESAGGGATIGNGSHTLDSMIWWFGEPESFEYFDDDFGGCEADSLLQLKMKNEVQGVVELSRTRSLRNTSIIRFEHGEIEVPAHGNTFTLRMTDLGVGVTGEARPISNPDHPEQLLDDLMADQFDDLATAIATGGEPAVSGREGRRSVALIEACYASRKPLTMPWIQPDGVTSSTTMNPAAGHGRPVEKPELLTSHAATGSEQ